VYVPAGYRLVEIINQLQSEKSTAENIKSKQTRKNVLAALEKIIQHLKNVRHTPQNGLVVFAGNISKVEGRSDIHLWSFEPPEEMKTKIYWCDQVFVLDPLREMVQEKEVYGLIVLDSKEADIGLLRGKRIVPLRHLESIVPGKTTKGGFSQMRYQRVREGLKRDFFKEVGEIASKLFLAEKHLKGVIVGGPGPVKDEFMKEDVLHYKIKEKVLGIKDVSYTGEPGLEELAKRSQDLLKEAAIVHERKLLERFFAELQKNGMVAYGEENVYKAIRAGAVDKLLISEALEEKKAEKLTDEAANYGTTVELISTDTQEGQQFKMIGGVGALLRFKI
jgi:peptide chain release factor subunit 1